MGRQRANRQQNKYVKWSEWGKCHEKNKTRWGQGGGRSILFQVMQPEKAFLKNWCQDQDDEMVSVTLPSGKSFPGRVQGQRPYSRSKPDLVRGQQSMWLERNRRDQGRSWDWQARGQIVINPHIRTGFWDEGLLIRVLVAEVATYGCWPQTLSRGFTYTSPPLPPAKFRPILNCLSHWA